MLTLRLRDRAPWLAAAVVLASALSACGSSSSTATDQAAAGPTASSSSPTAAPVKPADGPMLSAQGFSFHAPRGWADITDRAETGVLLSAGQPTDEQPLIINVRRVAPGAKTSPSAQTRATALLKTAQATGVRTLPDTTVAGFPATHVVGKQNLRGTHYQLDVYYVRTPNAGWSLTFATNQFTTPERRAAMLASVLETCRWQHA